MFNEPNNNQILKQEQYDFQFYKKQTLNQHGRFDLRFQSIKQSPINSHALQQLKFAAGFQIKKTFIHSFYKGKDVLQTQKDINLISEPNTIKMTWMGHATVLLSINSNTHILIDPMFQNRVVSYVGQKRHIPPPCKIHQLPKIDFVLISHDHYDHCNTDSLKDLYKRNPQDIHFIVGRNSRDVLPTECKSEQISQMSWTKCQQFVRNNNNIKITFVPACHWSKRLLNDQNKRLWGGFVIETLGKKIYFAGDTGYCGLFKQLSQVFKGFDLSLLPIGAYEPNQSLKAQHINPRQAVQVHNQIKSKISVGIHWGTFPMSHETPEQVLNDLNQARQNIESGEFITVKIGGSVSIDCKDMKYYQTQELIQ